MEHVWVNAWVDYVPSRGAVNREGDSWIALDPSFKRHDAVPGLDIGAAVLLNASGVLDASRAGARCEPAFASDVAAGSVSAARASFGARASDYLATQGSDLTVDAVLGRESVVPEDYSILVGTLPYATLSEAPQFSALPDALRWKLRLRLFAGEAERGQAQPTVALASGLSALSGRRVTLSFAPASEADAAVLASFLPRPHADGSTIQPQEYPASIPGYLVRVKAQLHLDGALVSEGGSFVLGSPLIVDSGLFDPSLAGWMDASALLTAGDYHALALDALGQSASHMEALAARADALHSKLEAGEAASLTRDELTGELLWQGAMAYFGAADAATQLYARASGTVDRPLPSYARMVAQVDGHSALGVVLAVTSGGIALDIDRLANAAAAPDPRAGSALQRTRLELASAYAQSVLGRIFTDASRPGNALSAVGVLARANAEGQRVYQLDASRAAQLDAIEIDARVRAELRERLAAGQHLRVSERPVLAAGVTLSGYVLEEPDSGAGEHRIVARPGGAATALLPAPAGLPWLALIAPQQISFGVPAALASAEQLAVSVAMALRTPSTTRLALYSGQQALVDSLFLAQLSAAAGTSACERVALDVAAQVAATLGATPASLNRAPIILSQPLTAAVADEPYRYQASATDPEGDAVSFRLSEAPGGASVSSTGTVSWELPAEGTYRFVLVADDGRSYTEQRYAVTVDAAPAPLALSLGVSPAGGNAGGTRTGCALTTGGTGTVSSVLSVDGQPVALGAGGSVTISAAASGAHRIVATATDRRGTMMREAVYSVRDPNDLSVPVAVLDTPTADAEVTAPLDVVGSASAAQLAYWQLLYRAAGEGGWSELNRGFSAVANGVLARFDPTQLANDLYDLQLRVVDINGREAASNVTVEVTRDQVTVIL
jgi:hypothetical protein